MIKRWSVLLALLVLAAVVAWTLDGGVAFAGSPVDPGISPYPRQPDDYLYRLSGYAAPRVVYPDVYPWEIVPCLSARAAELGCLCVGPMAREWWPGDTDYGF